jgi:predicted O-methyltransferase YrrM
MTPRIVALDDLTPGLIGRPAAELLAGLAAEVPADRCIVEVGVFLARTTTFLARGAQSGNGAHVYGVDPWDLPGSRYPYQWLNHPKKGRVRQMFTRPQTRADAETLIETSGLADAVTLIRGFSVDIAGAWDGPQIGLLFIDGDHREEYVRADWQAWRTHLASDALVVWDDYHPGWPDVPAVVDDLISQGVLDKVEVVTRTNGALVITRVHP